MKKHIVINGKVQGVGFRYWLSETAKQKNIYGWVRNKVSGEVEALFIGDETKISDLIELCKKGPSSSKVTKIIVQNYQEEYLSRSFNIISDQ